MVRRFATATADGKTSTMGTEAERAAQEAQEQAAAAAAKAAAGGEATGDKAEALRQERERRRQAEAALKQTRDELERLKAGGEIPGDVDLTDFSLSDDDMMDGKKVAEKFRATMKKVAEHATKQALAEVRKSGAAKDVDALLAKYPIYADADPTLSELAAKSVASEIRALPATATFQEVEAAVAKVAKQFSEIKAGMGGGAGAATRPAPLAAGQGTAEAGNLNREVKKCTTFGEASQKAREIVDSFLGKNKTG
jgi:hypothetical protein